MSNGLNWHFAGVIAIFYRTLAIYENTEIQNTYGINTKHSLEMDGTYQTCRWRFGRETVVTCRGKITDQTRWPNEEW